MTLLRLQEIEEIEKRNANCPDVLRLCAAYRAAAEKLESYTKPIPPDPETARCHRLAWGRPQAGDLLKVGKFRDADGFEVYATTAFDNDVTLPQPFWIVSKDPAFARKDNVDFGPFEFPAKFEPLDDVARELLGSYPTEAEQLRIRIAALKAKGVE